MEDLVCTTRLEDSGWYDVERLWGIMEEYHPINWGVQNMTLKETIASILEDLIVLHFEGWPFGAPWYDFFRFIQTDQTRDKVLEALCHPTIEKLTTGYEGNTHIMRLQPDHGSVQKAMNTAGIWYPDAGFEVPEGVVAFGLTEKGEALGEELGVEGLAQYVLDQGEKNKDF